MSPRLPFLSPVGVPMIRLLTAATIMLAATALAGGFSISEVGSRASGRGGAAAALYDDASAIYYNPANISRLEGLNVSLGISGLMPGWEWSPPAGATGTATKSESTLVPPPHGSVTYLLGHAPVLGDVAAGVGFYVPYGSSFSWPTGWAGSESVQKIALTVYELAPTLAVRPHRTFALGASFRYLPASVYLNQAVRFGSAESGTVELSGTGAGFGASAGLSLWPIDRLSIALAWRSPVTLNLKGASNFNFPPPFDPNAVDKDVKTSVPLAQVFRLGVAVDAVPRRLNLSADVEYQLWSTFKSLDIRFQNADGTETISSSPRDSKNSFVVHAGGEVHVTDAFAIRAGYAWDQLTLPELTVNPAPPDSDKHVVSVGASYNFEHFGINAHFSDVFFVRRTSLTSPFPGTWTGAYPGGTMAYIFGLSLTTNLDVGPAFGPRRESTVVGVPSSPGQPLARSGW